MPDTPQSVSNVVHFRLVATCFLRLASGSCRAIPTQMPSISDPGTGRHLTCRLGNVTHVRRRPSPRDALSSEADPNAKSTEGSLSGTFLPFAESARFALRLQRPSVESAESRPPLRLRQIAVMRRKLMRLAARGTPYLSRFRHSRRRWTEAQPTADLGAPDPWSRLSDKLLSHVGP